MKKFIKKFIDILAFCLGITNTEISKEAEKSGICDFSGQGRKTGGDKNEK